MPWRSEVQKREGEGGGLSEFLQGEVGREGEREVVAVHGKMDKGVGRERQPQQKY